jgi:NAD-dependent DNA ligase/DNA polymerase/3'-5' exonuclease PolX
MSQFQGMRLNEKFIDLMEQLASIMLKQGEPFRARAYQKAQETIISIPHDIKSPSDLKDKPNIGSTIMEKLTEYFQTGTLQILEREKNNPINILSEVYGIGPKKAKELVDQGIITIEQLREFQNELLNDTQKVGLKYYEDILKRIPRSEIEQYKERFNNVFETVCMSDSKFEIVGSYRRGAETSGDIDIIITSQSYLVFKNFIDILISKKIIVEVLSRGSSKCLVIARIFPMATARRVDFLYTPKEEYPFSILYFTGSKFFNTVMRQHAVSLGFTMNEHGLYKLDKDGKTKGDKVSHIFNDEKSIFEFLNLEYKTPVERVDGRGVVIKNNKQTVDGVSVDENNKKLIDSFKKNGIAFLNKLNENQLTSIWSFANVLYRNNQPIMTDSEFDILEEYIKEKYPLNQTVLQIGAPVEKNKVTLPYQMASMDKIKPDTDALSGWMKKYNGPYVLSCKLDGVSGLYTTEGKVPKLYTRGDGVVGQDISHLIPYLDLPKKKDIVIRGEFIIPKAIFETKYKNKFANPRNMVAGIINHKSVNETVHDIHFVSYEVIKPLLKPSQQMYFLQFDLKTKCVFNRVENAISNELLSQLLIDNRRTCEYEIDGIIVTNDLMYQRKTGNPEHAFAFKMVLSEQLAEATVVDVIWTPSKDGYLKPRVQILPIQLGGVKIEYATGFNAAFIRDNNIGIGTVVKLVRSGDVIPHILNVTVPASLPKMPDVPFVWNDTQVDILLKDIGNDETVKEKVITGFFKGIGVEGLGSGNVVRIMQSGFDSIPKIIKMSVDDFLTVDGFKDKTAAKLHNGIKEKLDSSSLVTLMSASNLFGRGFNEKKLELIMESYPNVLLSKESNSQKINKIASIKGMGDKTAEAFVIGISDFIKFMHEAGLNNKLLSSGIAVKNTVINESHPLFGKTIVMTGFRDANIQEDLKNVGAKLGASVSKNTFMVLVKDLSEDTGKAADARKIGVPLMTPEVFKKKYL